MKVIQVNCVYKVGSTGKIVSDIHEHLKANNQESIVCYGRGAETEEQDVLKICGEFYSHICHFLNNITGLPYGSCHIPTLKLKKIIRRESPDIVHLHCLNGYFINIYELIKWLNDNDIRCVLTLHAEFMHTANCSYALDCDKWQTGCGKCPRLKEATESYFIDNTAKSWKLMKKAFDDFKNIQIVSVSPWLMNRAKHSPIMSNLPHSVILNGVNTDIFHHCINKNLIQLHKPHDEKILFHATPFLSADQNHIKGGYYLIELAKLLINQNIRIIIAGNYDADINLPENITLLGRITDQKLLAEYYSVADITILTSKKETFSMITAESLCCGTPVVGFQAGAPEQIAIADYSNFVPFGNIELLRDAVNEMLNRDSNKIDIENKAHKVYSNDNMIYNYIKLYQKLMDKA